MNQSVVGDRDQDVEFRRAILAGLGASRGAVEELLAYNANVFVQADALPPFPLADEPHVARWQLYLDDAATIGVFESLKRRLPQLQFPIQQGISSSEDYNAAVRKGEPVTDCATASGLVLEEPNGLRLKIHEAPAGRIPVLIPANRADFESLVQAIIYRGEPQPVPSSMGAAMITGLNNWDRIREYRFNWESANPAGLWMLEWSKFLKKKELYQDRLILLSKGPYSGVAAQELGLAPDQWFALSETIRMEHECTHYFTQRVFASMRNNMLDELLADFMGILAAQGHYRADWFLHFVGLESYPEYHVGRRLENYRGELSDEAFGILGSLVKCAAENLETFDREFWNGATDPTRRAHLLAALTRTTLELLASENAPQKVTEYLAQVT